MCDTCCIRTAAGQDWMEDHIKKNCSWSVGRCLALNGSDSELENPCRAKLFVHVWCLCGHAYFYDYWMSVVADGYDALIILETRIDFKKQTFEHFLKLVMRLTEC